MRLYLLTLAAAVAAMVLGFARLADAEVFTYTTPNGTVGFTDSLKRVPAGATNVGPKAIPDVPWSPIMQHARPHFWPGGAGPRPLSGEGLETRVEIRNGSPVIVDYFQGTPFRTTDLAPPVVR